MFHSFYKLFTLVVGATTLVGATPYHNPYMYLVYNEGEGCQADTILMVGYGHGDEELVLGGLDNSTGLCAKETLCILDPLSEPCEEVLYTAIQAELRFDIDVHGQIFHCDSSNTNVDQAICRVLHGCTDSSIYGHCFFQALTTLEILQDPSTLHHANTSAVDALDLQSYMVLYSDDECSEFQAAHGIVAGESMLRATTDALTCEQSVACAFNPHGELCESYGGTVGDDIYFRTLPAADNAIWCSDVDDDESCISYEPQSCMQSELFPSCYYKFITAKTLFGEPEEYVKATWHLNVTFPTSAPTGNEDSPTASPTGASGAAASPRIAYQDVAISTLLLLLASSSSLWML